ncbi:uncharacterized protein [Haliotis asinina]|uniref:uncharacterized protein n=1 Tax=Haliotis asinina TaxID=109174 RepID=UPI003531897B
MPPGAIPFPFGDCRICNDRATGVHYGLATCEGCKGFFKRSIPKGDKYKCFFGGQCVITPQNRNRCKSCRYRKCLELGMSFEAVKMGRIPKMEKQRALDAVRNPGGCVDSPDSGIDDDAFNMVAGHVTDRVTNQLTNQVTNQMSKLLSNDVAPHQFCSYGNSSGEVPHPQSSSSYQQVPAHIYSETFPQVPWNDDIGSFSEQNRDQPKDPKEPGLVGDLDGSGTSNMNLLAETALLPKTSKRIIPEAASVSDDSNTSSNSCSMYSPNVIKVLFNQVVEMTGGNKVSEIVIEELAKKCPDKSSMRLLKRLSSETYINTASNTTEAACSVPVDTVRESGQEWSPLAGQLFTSSGCQSSNWNKTDLKQDSLSSSEQQMRYFDSSVFLHDDDPSDVTIGSTASKQGHGIDTQYVASSDTDFYTAEHPDPQVHSFHQDVFTQDPSYQVQGHEESQGHPWHMDCAATVSTSSAQYTSHTESNWSHDQGQPVASSDTEMIQSGDARSGDVETENDECSAEDIFDKGGEEAFDALLKGLEKALEVGSGPYLEARHHARIFIQEKLPMPREEITEETVKDTWNQLFQGVHITNERIIGFCNAVPGFSKINVEDQKMLLKRAYYDIWMLTCSEFFVDGESYLRFPNGRFYNRFWMEFVIKEENVRLLFSFADNFNKLHLSDIEIAIIAAIQLTSPRPDNPGLKDSVAIQKLNSVYLDLLVHIITKRNPDNSSRILVDIFRLLPQLAEVNNMQQNLIANFTQDAPPS